MGTIDARARDSRRHRRLIVVMIAGVLEMIAAIDNNAGAGDGRHYHRR